MNLLRRVKHVHKDVGIAAVFRLRAGRINEDATGHLPDKVGCHQEPSFLLQLDLERLRA